MAKKYKLLSLALCFTALYGILIKAALSPSLPSLSNPIVLYSNQKRDDIRLVLNKCFTSASQSIDLWMYAATDALLINLLQKKASKGVQVTIHYDKKGGTKSLPSSLHPHIVKTKGLMHRKIALIDNSTVFIGSANMTTSSLQHHDNLTVGIYDPQMASFLKSPPQNTYAFNSGLIWLLPDPKAADKIASKIENARTSIFIAMFTLTHNDLLDALIRAKNRGVIVKLAIDRYTARGASKKAVEKLSRAGIKVILSSGLPLLHHKWAYIDRQELILGSTNWTQAAFRKNQDILLFLHPLPKTIQSQIDTLITSIEMESTLY